MQAKIQEMNDLEIDEVNGAGVVGVLIKGVKYIGSFLYNEGMANYNMGYGDQFLEAVNGGNLGA